MAAVDERLQAWLDNEEKDGDEDRQEAGDETEARTEEEDDLSDRLIRPEVSLALYQLYLAFDGQHLPWAGGLVDQAEWWIHDVNILAKRKARLRRKMRQGEAAQKRVEKLKQLVDRRKRKGR